jgi:hypothetical protein
MPLEYETSLPWVAAEYYAIQEESSAIAHLMFDSANIAGLSELDALDVFAQHCYVSILSDVFHRDWIKLKKDVIAQKASDLETAERDAHGLAEGPEKRTRDLTTESTIGERCATSTLLLDATWRVGGTTPVCARASTRRSLRPFSWSDCATIVDRNKHTYASYNSYARNTQIQEGKFVRYLGGYKPEVLYQNCVYQTSQACRPSRFLFPETTTAENGLSLLMGTVGNISVAGAIAKFYSADKDVAGHVAINAVRAARRAGTTCGGLTGLTSVGHVGQTNLERAMACHARRRLDRPLFSV